ncbi:hypothetical protein N0V90_005378 [Kalmusia sp. IMI 367209]|nr:hypothetical protein N0V90_005378 [Kalmusia sp. IMI 367209]
MGKSRQANALAVTCVLPILAALFVAARSVSRHLGRNFGWDDWLIHLSLLLLLGQTVTIYQYILVSHTGYHKTDIPKQTIEEQVYALKWSFAVQMFYHPMMGAIRASIIMFLFRVKDQRWHIRWALHVVFWINIGYLVSTSIVNIFQCDPVRYAYLRPQMDHVDANGNTIKGGKCINTLQFIMSSCALSIFMDLIIMPIPTAMVWNLQMKRKTKIAVVAVMSVGWIATIASVVRLIVYYYRYAPTTDRTYNIGLITSIIEPSIAIIAACAPALRRLFTFMMPHYFSDSSYPTYATTYPTNNATYSRSRPKRSGSFPHDFDFEAEIGKDGLTELRNEQIDGDGAGGEFGMEPIKKDTQGEEGNAEGEARWSQRTQSVKTGVSETPSKAFETEPFEILDHRQ